MLTAADHWLRGKFLLQTHVYTMRLPDKTPGGIKVRELSKSPSNRYRYRLISNSSKATDKLVKKLDEEGMMYAVQVVEKKTALKTSHRTQRGECAAFGFLVDFASWIELWLHQALQNNDERRSLHEEFPRSSCDVYRVFLIED